jgi:PAS domain S-box-containing protein
MNELNQGAGFKKQYLPILVAALIGSVLAVAAFKAVRYTEIRNLQSKFKFDAQDRINAIKREIETNLEAVQSLHSFYEGSEKVTRGEFRKFTALLLTRHPSIRALEWIPRVPLSEKDRYEEEARYWFPEFRITEREERGTFVSAQRREEYFPVYYVEPLRGNRGVLGFDVASEPSRRNALQNARDSGLMSATARITLLRDEKEQDAFIVFIPIYKKNVPLNTVAERRKNVRGFVLGVFEIGDMVKRALSYLKPSGIDLDLYDISNSREDIHLYKHSSRLNDSGSASTETEVKGRGNFSVENTFHVADKTWKVTAVPVAAYTGHLNDLDAWMTSSGVALLTLFIMFYLKKVSDQRIHSEKLIRKLADEINVRRQVETALIDSEREFRSLFENMNEAFAYNKIILDEKGRPVDYEFILVNDAFEKATGLNRDEVPGKRVTEVIPGIRDSKPDLISIYGEIAQTGKEEKFELYFEPFAKWYLINAYSPGKDHFVTVFEDITESKKTELERERLLAELSSKNRELEQVLYATSHDLRSPLVNVEGFSRELQYSMRQLMNTLDSVEMPSDAEQIIAGIVKKDVPEAMTYISRSISKMDTMLKGLLKLSRLGRHELRIGRVEMNELLVDVISNFEFKLKDSEISVNVSEVPPCRGDRDHIHQVFSNLFDNAVKYLDPGRPGMITLSGQREGDYSVYCLEDNGIGIDTDHQEKIFKLFQQLEPGEQSGEGLGLTIAHRIVERHHGKIWVESEPGKGSRFYVQLPA